MHIGQGIHRAVQLRADATATVYGDRRRSWRQVKDRVARYAAGLRALGLAHGDRVMIIAHNSDLYIETFYAIAWAGGVCVPGNFRWSEAEHAYALRDSGARFLIADAQHVEMARALATGSQVAAVLLLSDDTSPSSAAVLIAEHEGVEDGSGRDDDLFGIFYTGGTTGRPKGVMLSHRGIMTTILAVNAMTPFPPEPVFLHIPPMFHLAAAGAVFATSFYAGTHVVLRGFDSRVVAETIEHERITAALMVPTMFAMLDEYQREHGGDFSSVRRIRYGTAGTGEELLKRAMQLFPNAEFQQGYGQTEMSPAVTVLEPRFHILGSEKPYLRSAGRPTMVTELRIVDDALEDLPLGQVGEILARGPGVMLGYWNNPELTAATIVDGWVRTGDAGYMDAEGFLYIADRLKDMIISGGENVFSAEVEMRLQMHPAIAECAVIGVPDPKWGERVHAVVRFKPDQSATLDELVAHCREGIAGYKCPRTMEIWTEPLPMSPQGKIMKTDLRRPHWEGSQRQVG